MRIRFERPHHHHHHRRRQETHGRIWNIIERNTWRKTRSSTIHVQYWMRIFPYHRTSIEYQNILKTRSILRGYSSDQLNKNNHSTTLIIHRQQSLPPRPPPSSIAHTRIQHIPLDTKSMFKPIITRVIREEEGCIWIAWFLWTRIFNFSLSFLGLWKWSSLASKSNSRYSQSRFDKNINSSSHQDLRSLVNQTSNHAQELFTKSKNYSEK